MVMDDGGHDRIQAFLMGDTDFDVIVQALRDDGVERAFIGCPVIDFRCLSLYRESRLRRSSHEFSYFFLSHISYFVLMNAVVTFPTHTK
mmetsp:Transcript_18521/g.25680  ORF Transcript_18521/g.25680 Transcript_18521/m.25680 type:complete len:89 (-) Transcript_18521:399-665(-)